MTPLAFFCIVNIFVIDPKHSIFKMPRKKNTNGVLYQLC
ncbi:unnamed protein product, partial [Larinioides sclopetarius]